MAADQSSAGSDAGSSAEYQEIVVTDEGGARTIMLNRPHKYNAITLQVCCSDHYSDQCSCICITAVNAVLVGWEVELITDTLLTDALNMCSELEL